MYPTPENLIDTASSDISSFLGSPEHIKRRYIGPFGIEPTDIRYDGTEVLGMNVYFGINESETRRRRNKQNWHRDESVSVGDAGPLLIDIAIYLILKNEQGTTIETSFYTEEPAEFISTETYQQIFQNTISRELKNNSKTTWK